MKKVTDTLAKVSFHEACIKALQEGDEKTHRKYVTELYNGNFGDVTKAIAKEVDEFVDITDEKFHITQCYKFLQLPTDKEQRNYAEKAAYSKIIRLKEKKILEALGSGYYRKIRTKKEVMDWWNADMNEVPIDLPFGLGNYHRVFPDNIMGAAGVSNMGKTTYTYDTIFRNLGNKELWDFYKKKYQREPLFELHDTDTGKQNTRERIQYLTNGDEDLWKRCVTTYLCKPNDPNIADLINPDMITLIDYLQFTEAFIISEVLDKIYQKLRNHKGVCFYNLQKTPGRDTGEGAYKSLHKATLYIAIDQGRMKVVKSKNRRQENIDNWYCEFTIDNRTEFNVTRPLGPEVVNEYGRRVKV